MSFFGSISGAVTGVVGKTLPVINPYAAAAIGVYRGTKNNKGVLSGVAGEYRTEYAPVVQPLQRAIQGKAGELPPVTDPAIAGNQLADNSAAYRAARKRQLALQSGGLAGTQLTGPGGLGDSSGGTAKTLLGV